MRPPESGEPKKYQFDMIHRPSVFINSEALAKPDVMDKVFVQEYVEDIAKAVQEVVNMNLQPGEKKDAVCCIGFVDPKKKLQGSGATAHFFSRMEDEVLKSLKRKLLVKFQFSYESNPIIAAPDTEYLIHVRTYPKDLSPGQIALEFRLQRIDKNPTKPSRFGNLVKETRKFLNLDS